MEGDVSSSPSPRTGLPVPKGIWPPPLKDFVKFPWRCSALQCGLQYQSLDAAKAHYKKFHGQPDVSVSDGVIDKLHPSASARPFRRHKHCRKARNIDLSFDSETSGSSLTQNTAATELISNSAFKSQPTAAIPSSQASQNTVLGRRTVTTGQDSSFTSKYAQAYLQENHGLTLGSDRQDYSLLSIGQDNYSRETSTITPQNMSRSVDAFMNPMNDSIPTDTFGFSLYGPQNMIGNNHIFNTTPYALPDVGQISNSFLTPQNATQDFNSQDQKQFRADLGRLNSEYLVNFDEGYPECFNGLPIDLNPCFDHNFDTTVGTSQNDQMPCPQPSVIDNTVRQSGPELFDTTIQQDAPTSSERAQQRPKADTNNVGAKSRKSPTYASLVLENIELHRELKSVRAELASLKGTAQQMTAYAREASPATRQTSSVMQHTTAVAQQTVPTTPQITSSLSQDSSPAAGPSSLRESQDTAIPAPAITSSRDTAQSIPVLDPTKLPFLSHVLKRKDCLELATPPKARSRSQRANVPLSNSSTDLAEPLHVAPGPPLPSLPWITTRSSSSSNVTNQQGDKAAKRRRGLESSGVSTRSSTRHGQLTSSTGTKPNWTKREWLDRKPYNICGVDYRLRGENRERWDILTTTWVPDPEPSLGDSNSG